VLLEIGTPVDNGPHLAMSVVLPATGYLCGSTFVNKAFVKWLEKEHFPSQPASENLNVTWASLGLKSSGEFISRASVSFDDAKASFPKNLHYNVHVLGMAGFRNSWNLRIDQ